MTDTTISTDPAPWTRDMFEPDPNEPGVHFDRFAEALTTWVFMQQRTGAVTVAEAALAWNTSPEIIREAAGEAMWLFLGPDDTLDVDGE